LLETGWDQYLPLEFRSLRDFNISDNATDTAPAEVFATYGLTQLTR